MDEELNGKIENYDRELKKWRNKHRLAMYISGSAKNNLAIDECEVERGKAIAGAIEIGIMAISSVIVKNIILGIILGLIIFLILMLIAKINAIRYDKKLSKIGVECYWMYKSFFTDLLCDYNIGEDGAVKKNNDMYLKHMKLFVNLKQDYGRIKIYKLEDEALKAKFLEIQKNVINNKYKDLVVINDKIASLEFNNKFGVVTDLNNELKCMKYFSPSVQAEMIKSNDLKEFGHIYTSGKEMCLYVDYNMRVPDVSMQRFIYDKKSVRQYFAEAEDYCKRVEKRSNEIFSKFEKIEFMRGTEV